MADLVQRAIAAARLDPQVYEEVEADKGALPQAMAVVVIAAVASGIGALSLGVGFAGVLGALLGSLISWYVWALLIWAIGTKVLPEASTSSDVGELLRTTGFAASPGVLALGGLIPVVGIFLIAAAGLWQLAAMVVAVRQALDYTSTWRAIAVCVIGFLAMVAVRLVIETIFGGGAFGVGAPGAGDAPAIGALGSVLAVLVS